jgi:hypothetical protein
MNIPPLPEGFQLDNSSEPSNIPPLPEGFQLEGQEPIESDRFNIDIQDSSMQIDIPKN